MRILIADDSAIVRVIFEQNLGKEKHIQILDSVSNGRKALDKAREERPDIVILDDDMPEMNGFESANAITSELKIPAIILAEDENAKFDFAKPAAITILKKPQASKMDSKFFGELLQQINEVLKKTEIFSKTNGGGKTAAAYKPSSNSKHFAVLCVGASTGGPSTAQAIFQNLGRNFPLPILYTQHLDVGDDEQMAKWFSTTCHNLQVSLAKDGEEALPAHVYMAPANRHLVIEYVQENGTPILHLSDEEPVRFLRPAVDKMFFSAAKNLKHHCLALLLTGMGSDGAEGCKKIVEAGGTTIAEDESTCTVFGMPAQAIKMGAATFVLPRNKIAEKVLSLISENSL